MIETAKKRANRIGQPAGPLNIDAWVSGSILSDAGLRGKVVLLDYWRKWAGMGSPIMPPPQLRTWQNRYADRGLMIISVTDYSRYVTNLASPEKERAMKIEQKMLADWARANGLTHRLGIQKDDPMVRPPGPEAFEHVVVIDREGKVCLFAMEQPDIIKVIDDFLETLLSQKK
jgi:hypothetical protein